MTDVEPVLHNHATAQSTNYPCGGSAQYQMSRRRMCGGTFRNEYGFHRVLHFVPVRAIPPLLHIHLSITDSM